MIPWTTRRTAAILFSLLAIAAGFGPFSAAADNSTDYGFGEQGWNGLSQLVGEAAAAGVAVGVKERLDLSGLRPGDGVLIVYPTRRLPRADLAAFMYEGGRVAIADDFGEGPSLLAGFHIQRGAPPTDGLRLRDNRNLRIAMPGARHPLALDVRALVTNHPQVLHHGELDAIFSLSDDTPSAVVLAGAVGKGRLVAIGDSSVLINNMLEFRGNRAFAGNLVRYLAGEGRLWLVGPRTEFTGHYGAAAANDPLARLRDGLDKLSQLRLPEPALRASTVVIALLLFLYAATALPKRASLLRAVSVPALETRAGFAGRVAFYAAQGRDLSPPLLAYKAELEKRIAAALGIPAPPEPREVERALRDAGHPEAFVAGARALLLDLAGAALPGAEPVGPGKFHGLVAAGDRILAALPGAR